MRPSPIPRCVRRFTPPGVALAAAFGPAPLLTLLLACGPPSPRAEDETDVPVPPARVTADELIDARITPEVISAWRYRRLLVHDLDADGAEERVVVTADEPGSRDIIVLVRSPHAVDFVRFRYRGSTSARVIGRQRAGIERWAVDPDTVEPIPPPGPS